MGCGSEEAPEDDSEVLLCPSELPEEALLLLLLRLEWLLLRILLNTFSACSSSCLSVESLAVVSLTTVSNLALLLSAKLESGSIAVCVYCWVVLVLTIIIKAESYKEDST